MELGTSKLIMTVRISTIIKSELVCGACIVTTQVGAYLFASLGFIFKQSSLRSFRDNTSVLAVLVAEDDVLLLEGAADAVVEVLVPPAVLVDAVFATVEGSGVLVFTVLAVLADDGDELLDSARAEVLVGKGVDVAEIGRAHV